MKQWFLLGFFLSWNPLDSNTHWLRFASWQRPPFGADPKCSCGFRDLHAKSWIGQHSFRHPIAWKGPLPTNWPGRSCTRSWSVGPRCWETPWRCWIRHCHPWLMVVIVDRNVSIISRDKDWGWWFGAETISTQCKHLWEDERFFGESGIAQKKAFDRCVCCFVDAGVSKSVRIIAHHESSNIWLSSLVTPTQSRITRSSLKTNNTGLTLNHVFLKVKRLD